MAALALACEGGEGAGANAPLAERRDAAARRGIEWLLARKDAMGPDWAFAMFSYLHPLVGDPALPERSRESLDQTSRVPIAALPDEFSDPGLLRLKTHRPIVAAGRRGTLSCSSKTRASCSR